MFGAFAPLPLRLGGSTDEGLTAAQYLRACADLEAARRVVPFAAMLIDQNSNSPEILWYTGQHGVGFDEWPSIAWNASTSRTEITWLANYDDELGRRTRLKLLSAKGTLSGSTGRVLVDAITVSHRVSCAPADRAGSGISTAVFGLVVW